MDQKTGRKDVLYIKIFGNKSWGNDNRDEGEAEEYIYDGNRTYSLVNGELNAFKKHSGYYASFQTLEHKVRLSEEQKNELGRILREDRPENRIEQKHLGSGRFTFNLEDKEYFKNGLGVYELNDSILKEYYSKVGFMDLMNLLDNTKEVIAVGKYYSNKNMDYRWCNIDGIYVKRIPAEVIFGEGKIPS